MTVRWEGDGRYTPTCQACAWEGKARDVHSVAQAAQRSHDHSINHHTTTHRRDEVTTTTAAPTVTVERTPGRRYRVLVDGQPVGKQHTKRSDADKAAEQLAVEVTQPAPAPEPAPSAGKPEPEGDKSREQVIQEGIEQLPAYLVRYAESEGSADPLAVMHGQPFVKDGWLYVQMEGRGGTARGSDVEVRSGLRPYLRRANGGLGDQPKAVLRAVLDALGCESLPVAYNHPERGSTSARNYRIPLANLPAIELEPIHGARQSAKRASVTGGDLEPVVPMRPEGSPADVKILDQLWKMYDRARDTLAKAAAKKVSHDKLDEYLRDVRYANAQLLNHRRAMAAKQPASE